MTPTNYLGVRLARMEPQERRWRLRMLVGEQMVALGVKGHNPGCLHGPAWTKRELDGITYTMWRVGRADSTGRIIGGPNDGGDQ